MVAGCLLFYTVILSQQLTAGCQLALLEMPTIESFMNYSARLSCQVIKRDLTVRNRLLDSIDLPRCLIVSTCLFTHTVFLGDRWSDL